MINRIIKFFSLLSFTICALSIQHPAIAQGGSFELEEVVVTARKREERLHKHGDKRSRPAELVPGTLRVISVRMDYLPQSQQQASALLDHDSKAYISRYALGRDYHKVMRRRLQQLATRIEQHIGKYGYRAFVDSAPVLEKPIAAVACQSS